MAKTILNGLFKAALIILGALFVVSLVRPQPGGIKHAWESGTVQQARAIDMALYSYANDNEGRYPDGRSSTEVFQTLMDGGYVTDPAVFYLPMTDKIRALPKNKLKPENVCFDVTSGIDAKASDEVPVVFMTGYRVSYSPGGDAVPIIKPYPQLGNTWSDWWRQYTPVRPGIAVCYKTPRAVYLSLDANFRVSHFISPEFVTAPGVTYRQLTPEGTLP